MSDRWVDRLSEYLDGELPDGERVALEAHLATCSDCAAVLAGLRRVVSHAQHLEQRGPRRDLWPAIAGRIGATPPVETEVVGLASRRAGARRWSFSVPQLAAAAILLMTLSGGTVWLLRSPALSPTAGTAALLPAGTPPALNASATASQSYAAAVADLERVLATGRGELDTTTVRVIEQNLAAIDHAIAEAQRALVADPANLYLNTHLAETMRRKLDLLRQAATLVHAS
ncbi:MAG TPA: zf-HC2 domain-containing protein [Gemmatimonadales bacterium]|nr:zf-HC2 domain-containing protein [Gemmatimonadales bacterium]